MKLILKEFQEQAVDRLVRHLRGAARDSQSGDRQAVCLSSTTGSGKTVMLTSAIERLLRGDDEHAPISDATFLWITDQPELNEQTRRKMLATSSVLTSQQLLTIDAAFDEEMLQARTVHFLNIQKLGKDKGLVTQGDRRTFSIWNTIKNTIDARPQQFFVIVDEAHRGMTEERGQAEAASIIQKFIKGSPGEIPPVPVVVGISATPERFNQLIIGTQRMTRPVDVDVDEVRDSGLIKDMIVLHHPKSAQPTDMTLLREAARSLKKMTSHWGAYCASQAEFTVQPLLVVQVEDAASKGQISETDVGEAINVLRNEIGALPSEAFAHSFQEGVKLRLGASDVRYLAPSDIDADRDARVVFFKTSLNTGWDCPRAEVMMSFRPATDATNIAQLVGRMIRTPLARRVVEDETLNTVSLYLPHYDSKALSRVVARLSRPDDGTIPIDVERGEDAVELVRAPGQEAVFEALGKLPSYIVPRKRKANQVRRLMKFARLLTNDAIDDDAASEARKCLLAVLDSELQKRRGQDEFEDLVAGRSEIDIDAVNWIVGTEATHEGETIKVSVSAENLEDLFEATGRKLGEGLHKAWWRERVRLAPTHRDRAKLELFALCTEPEVMRRLERTAQEKVQEWLLQNASSIHALGEASRASYNEVRNLAASPELVPLIYPVTLQSKRGDKAWKKHLYVDDSATFSASLNEPESATVLKETGRKEVLGWLRNMDRKPWALCVPYEVDGEDRAMFPDFLVARSVAGQVIIDVIEPHSISLADSPAKAAGLAKFAAKHADRFGRIELILLDGKATKILDLTDESVRNLVRGIRSTDELRRTFFK